MTGWAALTEPWQHVCNGYVIGPGRPWRLGRVAGWFDFEVELNAEPYTYVPGSAMGVPHQSSPVISLGLELGGATDGSDVIGHVRDLRESWFTTAEVDWYTWFPGMGVVKATGQLMAGTLPEWTAQGNAPHLGVSACQTQLYVPDPASVEVVEVIA